MSKVTACKLRVCGGVVEHINISLKGNGNIFFIFSYERIFKTTYNTLLPFFHILLTSTNILIERNEMSTIFNLCRYACHVTTGVTQYFYLDNH
jgi:hypothetical protein